MIDVTRFDLHVEIVPHWLGATMPDAPGHIRCTSIMEVRGAAAEPARSAPFALYRLLSVSAATDESGAPLTVRQNLRQVEGWPAMHVNAISVDFPEPVAQGDRQTLRLVYEGPLVGYREVMPYVHDSVQADIAVLRPEVLWYPVLGGVEGGEDIVHRAVESPPFSVSVQCPEGWWAGMAGTRREPASGGVVRFHARPDWSGGLYLVAGRYTEMGAGEHVAAHHLPGHEAWAGAVVESAQFAAATLTEWLGARASGHDRLDIAEIPEHWGSQSSPGLILQVHRADPRWTFAEVAHEVSHHWTPGADPNRFCDEGMAHYLQARVEGVRYGEEDRWRDLDGRRKAVLRKAAAAETPLGRASEHPELVETVSRCKGPLALAVLDACLGDGDFFALLRRWLGSGVSPRGTAGDFGNLVRDWGSHRPDFRAHRFVREWFEVPGPMPLEGEECPIAEAVRRCAGRYGTPAPS